MYIFYYSAAWKGTFFIKRWYVAILVYITNSEGKKIQVLGLQDQAEIPAARGALADVPVCVSVQILRKSVVTWSKNNNNISESEEIRMQKKWKDVYKTE